MRILPSSRSLALVLGVASVLAVGACAGGDKKKDDPNAKAKQKATPADELAVLAADFWAFELREYPEYATTLGIHDHDDKLTDVAPEAFDRRAAQLNAFVARGVQLDPSALNAQDKLTLDILLAVLKDRVAAHDLGIHRWEALDHLSGPQSGGFTHLVRKYHPRATQKDLENLVARYNALGPWMDNYIALIRTGMEKQEFLPSVVVERVLEQVRVLAAETPEKSIFADVKIPEDIPAETRTALTASINTAVKDVVLPAFGRLQNFLETDYILNARGDVGVKSMPNGDALYAYFIRHHTTRELTADDLHARGLAELERVEKEMMDIAVAQKFNKKGKLQDFTQKLMKDKKNMARDTDALLAVYRDALERAKGKTPEVFTALPSVDIEVTEMDAQRAASAPAAYYESADLAATRKAQCVVNTAKIETRPLFAAESIAFHEAIPGHHVQVATAQQLKDIPAFRREASFGAFVEGWALYTERLADELGLYSTPLQRYGYLGARAWRAVRLVVDTGIHAKGWDRQKAVDFMKQHTVLGTQDVENEVDRYILWPGQALGYLVGAQEIEALRDASRAALGTDYDARAFHDAVLGGGALPLDILKVRVEAATQARKEAVEKQKAEEAEKQKAAEAEAEAEKQKAAEAEKQKAAEAEAEKQKAAEAEKQKAADGAAKPAEAAAPADKPAATDGTAATKDGKSKAK